MWRYSLGEHAPLDHPDDSHPFIPYASSTERVFHVAVHGKHGKHFVLVAVSAYLVLRGELITRSSTNRYR